MVRLNRNTNLAHIKSSIPQEHCMYKGLMVRLSLFCLINAFVEVTVSFSAQNYTVSEGDLAKLTIVLNKPSAKDITIAVFTIDGTAECETAYLFSLAYITNLYN